MEINNRPISRNTAILLVTLSAFFWGGNFNAGKIIVAHLSPLLAAALRFTIATIIILPIMFIVESDIKETLKRNIGIYIALGLIGVAGFNGLFFLGLKYTSPINGALIMATNPLVTMLFAALILHEPIRFNQRLGMLFSLIGVIIVITHASLEILLHLNVSSGDLIIMAANICWALYSVLGRRYLKNSKPLITTTATMVVGSLFLIAFASYGSSPHNVFEKIAHVYGAILYMAVLGSILAYLFWNYGIIHLGAGKTSIFFNLVPIFTVFISIFLGQSIALIQVLGGMLVISGVLISSSAFKFKIKPALIAESNG